MGLLALVNNQAQQTPLGYTTPAGVDTFTVLAGDTLDIDGNLDLTGTTLIGAENVDADLFGSGAALTGEVLTADGLGGASWVAPPAGTLQGVYDAGTGTINLDASGDFIVNLDSGSAGDAFKVASSVGGADALTLTSTGANAMSLAANTTTTALSSSSTTDIDAAGAVSVNSSGAAINVGDDAVAQPVNIGTGAAARTVTIGNATGATALDLKSGTGGINLNDGVAQLDLNGAGALTETALASANITPSGALTLRGGGISQFGDDTGYFNFDGNGALSTSGVTTVDLDCSGALQINSSAGAISIGNDAVAQAINIGTGAAARTVTVGTANSTASTVINSGSTGLDMNSTGPVALDGTNMTITPTGDLTIDGSGVTSQINLKTGTNTSATGINFLNDSGTPTLAVNGAGTIETKSGSTLDVNGAFAGDGATSWSQPTDSVKSSYVDWGSGADEIDSTEVPVDSAYTPTNYTRPGTYSGAITDDLLGINNALGTISSGIIIKANKWVGNTAEGTLFNDTDGVRPDQAVILGTVAPSINDTFVIKSTAGTETWTFVTTRGAPYQVTIGADENARVANLVSAINTDSAAVFTDWDVLTDIQANRILLLGGLNANTDRRTYFTTGGSFAPKYSKNATDTLVDFAALPTSDPVTTNFAALVPAASLLEGWTYVVRAGEQRGAWYTWDDTNNHFSESRPHQDSYAAGDGITFTSQPGPDLISVDPDGTTLSVGPNGVKLDVTHNFTGGDAFSGNIATTGSGTFSFGSSGAITAPGNPTINTGTGQVDMGGNLDASAGVDIDADSQKLTVGAGADYEIIHDGTNTTTTSKTGNLTIDNTAVAGKTILMGGTDTSATGVQIKDNSGTTLAEVDSTGQADFNYNVDFNSGADVTGANLTLSGVDETLGDNDAVVFGAGTDASIASDGTDLYATMGAGADFVVKLGENGGATEFRVEDSGAVTQLEITSDGDLTIAGTATLPTGESVKVGERFMDEYGDGILMKNTSLASIPAGDLVRYNGSGNFEISGSPDLSGVTQIPVGAAAEVIGIGLWGKVYTSGPAVPMKDSSTGTLVAGGFAIAATGGGVKAISQGVAAGKELIYIGQCGKIAGGLAYVNATFTKAGAVLV